MLGAQVSEENDDPIIFEDGGDYSVVFDPLDGSSNIDCGVSIGTIYGIYKKAKEEAPSVANVLRVRTAAAWDAFSNLEAHNSADLAREGGGLEWLPNLQASSTYRHAILARGFELPNRGSQGLPYMTTEMGCA